MIRNIIFSLSIFSLSSCATIVNKNPDLGESANYDFHTNFPDSNIEIAISQPVPIEKNSSTRLGKPGVFTLNLKITNTGDQYYLLDRKDVKLISNLGYRYRTLSIDKALDILFGRTGIYRALLLPDVANEYRLNGLNDLNILTPGNKATSTLSKYLFFHITNNNTNISDFKLVLPLKKISLYSKVNYSMDFSHAE